MSDSNYELTFKYRMTVTLPAALIGLVENVVTILTLTYWMPSWVLTFLFWSAKRDVARTRGLNTLTGETDDE